MMRRRACGTILAATILSAMPTGAGGQAMAPTPAADGERPTGHLERHLARLVPFGFSGAALVVRDGNVVDASGYGFADWGEQVPNGTATVFDIGSLSKQFTAAAVVLLAEQGLLALDDSIGKHFPYVPDDKRGITVHHLLTHTSGLPPFHAFGTAEVHGDLLVMTRHGAERAIMGSPLDFPPGEGWTYSNAGYTLLAALVERVGGRPFEAVLRSELFEPAGMARTGHYFEHLWNGATVARGYRESGDQGSPLEWADSDELWALIGGGGILSTVEDLAAWHRALTNGTVLPPRAVARLFAPHAEVREGLHYGYGWYIEDVADAGRVIRHGGANDFGFASRWRWYPEQQLAVVLLVNREPPGMDVGIAANAVEAVLDDLARGRARPPAPEAAIPRPTTDLARYAGRYRLEEGGELVIRAAMGGLAVEPRGPVPTRHLGFPAVSDGERETVGLLDRQALAIVEGMVRGEWEPLVAAMADPTTAGPFRDDIAGWWEDFKAGGGERDDVTVVGTVPSWWSLGDDRLATVVVVSLGERKDGFRLHWRDGHLVGLGGGAVLEPATTLFVPTAAGNFVGYHLGIQHPVRLSFEVDATGEVSGLRLSSIWTLEGERLAR